MKTPEELAEEWHWKNLSDQPSEALLTKPLKYAADPRKAFIAGYQAAQHKDKAVNRTHLAWKLAKDYGAVKWLKHKDYKRFGNTERDYEYTIARDGFYQGYQAAKEHAHAALEEAEARTQELRDQLMEESGGRLKLFKNDADAKAAYQECLEEIDLDKAWQEGYKAAQEEADTCEHILDMSKMVDVSSSVPLNNWISVKDRLPEQDDEAMSVLISGDGWHDYEVAYFGPTTWHDKYDDVVEGVTHWMPLPAAPKEKA
jgi:hypothetical protein